MHILSLSCLFNNRQFVTNINRKQRLAVELLINGMNILCSYYCFLGCTCTTPQFFLPLAVNRLCCYYYSWICDQSKQSKWRSKIMNWLMLLPLINSVCNPKSFISLEILIAFVVRFYAMGEFLISTRPL